MLSNVVKNCHLTPLLSEHKARHPQDKLIGSRRLDSKYAVEAASFQFLDVEVPRF